MPTAAETITHALTLYRASCARVNELEAAMRILGPDNEIAQYVNCELAVAQGVNNPVALSLSLAFAAPFFEAELIRERANRDRMAQALEDARTAMQAKP